MMMLLKIEAGTYCFKLPVLYFPAYKSTDGENDLAFNYDYGYQIDIIQSGLLTYLSIPEGSEKVDQS
jgi:hypothetical protein